MRSWTYENLIANERARRLAVFAVVAFGGALILGGVIEKRSDWWYYLGLGGAIVCLLVFDQAFADRTSRASQIKAIEVEERARQLVETCVALIDYAGRHRRPVDPAVEIVVLRAKRLTAGQPDDWEFHPALLKRLREAHDGLVQAVAPASPQAIQVRSAFDEHPRFFHGLGSARLVRVLVGLTAALIPLLVVMGVSIGSDVEQILGNDISATVTTNGPTGSAMETSLAVPTESITSAPDTTVTSGPAIDQPTTSSAATGGEATGTVASTPPASASPASERPTTTIRSAVVVTTAAPGDGGSVAAVGPDVQPDSDGAWRKVAIAGYLVVAAALGAIFSSLTLVLRKLLDDSYSDDEEPVFWLRTILGIIAGSLLAVVVSRSIEGWLTSGSDKANVVLTIPLLAVVGGFSADFVHRALQRIVDAFDTIISGSPEERIVTETRAVELSSAKNTALERVRMAGQLSLAQELLGQNLANSDRAQAIVRQLLADLGINTAVRPDIDTDRLRDVLDVVPAPRDIDLQYVAPDDLVVVGKILESVRSNYLRQLAALVPTLNVVHVITE